MYTVITILIIITCALLVLVVLVQNAKGGGLSSGFTGAGQMMGVQKTTDFIEKLTWGLAVTLVVLCLAASFSLPDKEQRSIGSAIQDKAENAGNSAPTQQTPATPAPQQQPPQEGQ